MQLVKFIPWAICAGSVGPHVSVAAAAEQTSADITLRTTAQAGTRIDKAAEHRQRVIVAANGSQPELASTVAAVAISAHALRAVAAGRETVANLAAETAEDVGKSIRWAAAAATTGSGENPVNAADVGEGAVSVNNRSVIDAAVQHDASARNSIAGDSRMSYDDDANLNQSFFSTVAPAGQDYDNGQSHDGDDALHIPPAVLPVLGMLIGGACMWMLLTTDRIEIDGAGDENRRHRVFRIATFQRKTDEVFSAADKDQDGFVSCDELRTLARVTSPRSCTGVTMEWFRDLCRPLGADPERGLNRREFRQSYMLLGSDVDSDIGTIRAMQGDAGCETATASSYERT